MSKTTQVWGMEGPMGASFYILLPRLYNSGFSFMFCQRLPVICKVDNENYNVILSDSEHRPPGCSHLKPEP